VTNMMESGQQEAEAQAVSGHKTNSVFRRYNIVRTDEMVANADRTLDYLDAKDEAKKPMEKSGMTEDTTEDTAVRV